MKSIKKILLPIACNLLLKPKTDKNEYKNIKTIYCDSKDINIMTNTSNNVIKIKIDNKLFYFRECKTHYNIHKFVSEEINYYYKTLHPELVFDKEFIENSLKNKVNFNKFVNMGIVNDFNSGVYNFCMGNGGNYIGLNNLSSDMEERIKDFAQYIWGSLFAYKLNNGLKENNFQVYNALRSIATYRIAKLIGASDLIPNTEYCKIVIDNKTTMFGTLMDEAKGICMERMSVESRKDVCSPQLQKALSILNILDVLCLEKDHRPGNYNVVIKDGKAKNIVAFDNDSPNSFGIGGISFTTYGGCSPWVINGIVNRPYFDKEVVMNIMSISNKDIDNSLKDLLNTFQMITLKQRVKKVQKILKTIPSNRFLEKDEWSEKTIQEEISGKYGITYLSKFLQEQEIPYQPWIKNKES